MNRNSKNAVTDNNTNNDGGIIMNNTMTMDVFATAVKETVEGILGTEHDVKVQAVIKNNSTHLTGLVIKNTNDTVAPTIYLEQFLEDYRAGRVDIESVSRQIVSVYKRSVGKITFDVASITDFSACKDNICYKLINAERNGQLLSEMPHVLVHDLAVVFFIFLGKETSFGTASIAIRNHMMDLWDTTTEELLDIAKKNTHRLLPSSIRPISNVLSEMIPGSFDNDEFFDMEAAATGLDTIFVCSNTATFWGAGVILYDDVLKGVADSSEAKDLYIIPSSIHETLLIPNRGMDVAFLKQMVHEVNATAVAPEEVLSDSVYVYRADTETIELA